MSIVENIDLSSSSQLLNTIITRDNMQEINLETANNALANVETKNFYDTYYRTFNTETKNSLQDNAIMTIRNANNYLGEKINLEESKDTTQDASITTLTTRVSTMESKNTAQDTSIASLNFKIKSEEITNSNQNRDIQTLSSKLANIKTVDATQNINISNLTTRMNSMESKNSTQDNSITSLSTRYADIEAKNILQDTIIISLNNTVYYSTYGIATCKFVYQNTITVVNISIIDVFGNPVRFSYERRGLSENVTVSPFAFNTTTPWNLYT